MRFATRNRRWLATAATGFTVLLLSVNLSPATQLASTTAVPRFIQARAVDAAGTRLTVQFVQNVGGGDLLAGMFRTASATSVSDSLNGSWTNAGSSGVNSLWYRTNAKAGATTVTVSAKSSGPLRADVAEYSGVKSSDPLAGASCNAAPGSSSRVTTGDISILAGRLGFIGMGAYTNQIKVTAGGSAGAAATLRKQLTGSSGTEAIEDVIPLPAGTNNGSFSLSGNADWVGCIAAFRPATVAASTPTPIPTSTPIATAKSTPTLTPAATPTPTSTPAPTSTSMSTPTPTPSSTPPNAGNGAITYDGTFSTTDPANGPHWHNAYGSCYAYVSPSQLSMTPQSGCSPVSDHLRTDICSSSGCSATAGSGQVYAKGVPSCTTIPFYLPRQIPGASGNSWYQIAEMKDYTSVGADWSIGIAGGGVSELNIGAPTPTNQWNSLYGAGAPVSAGTWHTVSICTDNNTTIYGAWVDGKRITFNQGNCRGLQTCTGLSLFYDGYNTQPLDINAYTGNTSGTDPWGGYTVIHGDPLVAAIGSNGLPPEPAGGWNSP